MDSANATSAPASDPTVVGLIEPLKCRPTFQREKMRIDLLQQMQPLLFEHWNELVLERDRDIALKPLWANFDRAWQAGVLRIFTVRQAAYLVGYGVFVVGPNGHSADSIQAKCDVIWLAPHLRGKRSGEFVGEKFIEWIDLQLYLEDKVQKVHHHVKVLHNWGITLTRLGYSQEEIVFTKRLDLDPRMNVPGEGGDFWRNEGEAA